MKRDEVRSILGEITEEQLDAIMKLNGESVNAEKTRAKELQKQLDEAKSTISAMSEETEASKKASLTLEERMKAIEESYAAKERDLAMAKNALEAERILSEAGIIGDEAEPIMKSIVTADMESTAANAQAIAALVSAKRDSAVAEAKKALLASTPSPTGASGGNASVTKEQFDSMGYSERLKIFNESRDLYNELNS